MSTTDDAILRALASIQTAIRDNQAVFDSIETIAVRPAFVMVRGQADTNQPYIQVRARRAGELRNMLPPTAGGFPIRVMQASLEEQANRAAGMARAGVTADSTAARIAWRTGQLELVPEARNYSNLTYQPMNPSLLTPVESPMELVIHVSPEAGWAELRKFLQAGDWIIGMYDFTAPHIVDGVQSAVRPGGEISLVLDRRVSLPTAGQLEKNPDDVKAADVTELSWVSEYRGKFGSRFLFNWASTGSKAEFASAYHIKVAVRDRREFWLSSGNWQSSNQPATDFLEEAKAGEDIPAAVSIDAARYNREWHAICRHAGLADVFAKYIERDYKNAKGSRGPHGAAPIGDDEAVLESAQPEIPDEDFVMECAAPRPEDAELEAARRPREFFGPLSLSGSRKIQPVLTPDNYHEIVAPLIEGATKRLWFQNQSLKVVENRSEGYDRLLTALKDKSWELEDCRIIFRDFFRYQTRDQLRGLKEFGFNMDKVRVMRNCHTKGILVDSRQALLGSHNWTNEGTTYNRDASLLFDDAEVTGYLERVFAHDWDAVSFSLAISEESANILLFPGESARPGTTARKVQVQDHDGLPQFVEDRASPKMDLEFIDEY